MRSTSRSSKGLAGRGRRYCTKDNETDKDTEDKDEDHLEKTLKKTRRGEESEEVVRQTKIKTKTRR